MQNASKLPRVAEQVRVAVCIATFRRPHLLQSLLDALAGMSFNKAPAPSLQIFVIDNDAARSAHSICRHASLPWPVQYVCEPQRGIASARNRAIDCAAGSDFLAFIDDDELPAPCWLDELLHTQSEFQADVVMGSVIPAFSADVPDWIRKGRFFDRPTCPTGSPVKLGPAGNVLIDFRIFDVVPRFDRQFDLNGGEDTHFFLRVHQAGLRMVFSREAVVHEPISDKRANVAWLLRRGFQVGNSWAHCEKSVRPGWRVGVTRVAKELIHVCRGILNLFATPFTGKAELLRSLQKISASVGTLAGVAGYRFLPYSSVQETLVLLEEPLEQTRARIETEPVR